MRCFTSLALVAAFGTLIATAAQAADMAFPPMEGIPAVSEQPVELGTGWYLRGDVAWSRDHAPLLSSDGSLDSQSAATNGYSFDLGFGYKFNNWLRSDIVYDYRKPYSVTAAESNVWCPYNLMGLTTQGSNPVELGYFANPNDTCTPQQHAALSRQDLLLNGYIDLGTWGGVTPYVGAGVGTSMTQSSGSLNYYETANNTLYNANLTPTGSYPPLWIDDYGNPVFIGSNHLPTACPGTSPPTCPQPPVSFTQQNWNKTLHSTAFRFAWALMGGFAIAVTDHLQADIGYRYVDLGTYSGIENTAGGAKIVSVKQSTQEIRVGFRYMVD